MPTADAGASLRSGVGWALAAAGGAGLAGAGVLAALARERYDGAQCARSCTALGTRTRAEARALARGATLSGGVAISALLGAALLWWASDAPSSVPSERELVPSVARSELSLSIRGRF